MDNYQTLDTDPYEQGVSSEEGIENVDSTSEDSSSENETAVSAPAEGMTLTELNELLGRKGENSYKSLDDVRKALPELKSLVGAKAEPQIQKNLTSEDKYGYMAQEIFSLKAPDAAEYLDVIIPYAKANKLTLMQAWETKFADVFTKEEPPKDSSVIKPNRRVRQAEDLSPLKQVSKMTDQELKDNYFKLRELEETARTR